MTTVAEAFVTIRPDMSGFGRELQTGVQTEMGGGASAAGSAGVGAAFGSAMKKVGRVGGLALLSGAVGSFVGGFRRLSSLEDFGQMLDAAQVPLEGQTFLMEQLNDILTGTPFALDAGAQAMLGFVTQGRDLEEIPGLFEQVTDAAAFGKAPLDEVSQVWQRIGLQGRATNRELQMLTFRNIPVYSLLADAMGITEDKVRDLAQAGEISADDFFEAWGKGAEGFGDDNIRIAGAAQAMGEVTSGALANLGTAFSRLGARVLGPFFGSFPGFLSTITDWVNRLGDVLEPVAVWLAETLPDAFRTFRESETFSQIVAIAEPVVTRLRELLEEFWAWAVPFWEEHGEDIMAAARVMAETLMEVIGGVLTIIQGLVQMFVAITSGDFELWSEGIMNIFRGLGRILVGIWRGMWDLLLGFFDTSLAEVQARMVAFGAGIILWFRRLPGRIMSVLRSLPGLFRQLGRDMIQGLIDGMRQMAPPLVQHSGSVARMALMTARRMLGASSPSKAFMELGKDSAEGFMIGLSGLADGQVMPTLQRMAGPGGMISASGARSGVVINGNVTVGSRDDLNEMRFAVRKLADEMA